MSQLLLVGLASLLVANNVEGQNRAHDAQQTQSVLSLRQLDVGQGDAALLTTPEGRRILIDAGPDRETVAEMLSQARIDTLDLVIASHAHADHIGGMSDVFLAVVVRAYLDNGIPYTTATYARTLTSVENEAGLQYLLPTPRTITMGSVTLRVLPPPLADNSQNNNSVGILVEYGRFSALYTGDSEQAELTQWLQDGRISRVTMVKAAHHGSRNGVTGDWVKKTSPSIVLISVGSNNRYGHPSPETEQLWSGANARVYRTDQSGEIEVRAQRDGSYSVRTGSNRENSEHDE
jgi:competence protein ComEC